MSTSEEISFCSNCANPCLFSAVNQSADANYEHHKTNIIFRKGETLFKQGTFVSKVVYIQDGLVKMLVEGTSGKDLIVRFFGKKEYLGLNQLFGKKSSSYTAVAAKNSRVCVFEAGYYKKLIQKDPGLMQKLLPQMAEENGQLYNQLGVLGTKNLHGRLAQTLLYLSSNNLWQENIYHYITRKELAELSAMSVESLVRLLNEFKADRIISINGKEIEIINQDLINILLRAG